MKKYRDSTLKAMKKAELIEYIRMLEYNHEVMEATLNQQAENIKAMHNNIIKQLEELAEEHPYKKIGEPDTYSPYNEAWENCCDRAMGIVRRGGIKAGGRE